MIATENVIFSNQNNRLVGTLYKPHAAGPHPALIVLHAASGGTRSYPFYEHLATDLPRQGIAVLIYDRRGSGESTGDFASADFDDLAQDALAALQTLKSNGDIDPERIGLYGISQGGWIAPIAASRSADVALLIVVSGSGVSPAEQMTYAASFALREAGYAEGIIERVIDLRRSVDDYYRANLPRQLVQTEIDHARSESWFKYAFLGAGELPKNVKSSKWYYEFDYDPLPIWSMVRQPTLFIFAEVDRWVPVDESISCYTAATAHMQDVTMIQIEGTNHLMNQLGADETRDESAQVSRRYTELLMEWLAKHFGRPYHGSAPTTVTTR